MAKFFQYLQEKVVFLPATLPDGHTFSFNRDFEEYYWNTPFEGKINVLHFRIKNPKGVILYLHGNSDNLHRWGIIASEFTDYQYDVLVLDYRGYGKSSGPRNEEYLNSDIKFAFEFAKQIYGEENIVIYGRSLGGAFATKIAADNQPKLVILESTFFNLQDIVNRWLPEQVTNKISPTMTYHFLSNENIKKVTVPLFHFHGSKDFVVPIKSGKKLFETFEKAQPHIEKKFIEISGGNHDNLISFEKFNLELKKILI